VAEIKHVDQDVLRHDTQRRELGHPKKKAFLAADRGMDTGPPDAVPCGVSMDTASSGVNVVIAAPVSSTRRPKAEPRGPATRTVTTMKSSSGSNCVSSLFIEDQGGARWPCGDAPRIEMADELVAVTSGHRLVYRRAPGLAMANDARRPKCEAVGM
jgi:hypothetical protein